jgi:hypothetical protein
MVKLGSEKSWWTDLSEYIRQIIYNSFICVGSVFIELFTKSRHSTIKTDCYNITEILLKVASNTTNLNLCMLNYFCIIFTCVLHFFKWSVCWGEVDKFELTTLVVIGINCTGSCKSNYHMIMVMTAPKAYKVSE